MILLSFCTFPWWLSWLLPFLLGLALGWALWSKYKSEVEELESNNSNLKASLINLEGEIKNKENKIAELEGEMSTAKGKLRETEIALEECRNSGNSKKGDKKKKSKLDTGVSALAATSDKSGKKKEKKSTGKNKSGLGVYASLQNDNLQIIEGIGPKMEEVLKANSISKWKDLSEKTESDLRDLLNNYGDKYKIIDVATWQDQAKFAANGDFDGLINMQKNISGGSANTLSKSDSKLEKYLIKKGLIKAFVQDDLKAIEGIGPKISDLLNNAGITTWRALANSSSDDIKKILDAAGSRFKLADPGTWSKQAELAADGKFDELRAYQDELQGGR